MINRKIVISALATSVMLVATHAYADRNIQESLPLSKSGRIVVNNTIGSITVRGQAEASGPARQVELVGTIEDRVTKVEFTTSDEITEIDVKIPERGDDRGAELTITVPADVNLNISSVSAEILVENVSGKLKMNSVSGDIVASCDSDEINFQTFSGEVTISAVAAEIEGNAISGDIQITGADKMANVKTVSGDASISGVTFEYVMLDSVSGDLNFTGNLAPSIRCEGHTISGDLIFNINSDVSAEFTFESLSGDLETEFNVDTRHEKRFGPGKNLEFNLGGGSGRVQLETLSGDVELNKR